MKANQDRLALFEQWAATYDPRSGEEDLFPFAGYDSVLTTIVERAAVTRDMRVLDLGVGTGNLMAKFADLGCELWGVDFSAKMLERARKSLPQARLVQADLLQTFPSTLPKEFGAIVSAYVLHEFSDSNKVKLLSRLSEDYLAPGGVIVIGDVAFEDADVRAKAKKQWADIWDEEEYYWAADEAMELLAQAGLTCTYEQVSVCAGVFVIQAP